MIDPEGFTIDEKYKALINIDGDLQLSVDGEIVFEESVNFLELLSCLKKWAKEHFEGDFSFESSEFEDKGIVEFCRKGNCFVFRSCWAASLGDVVLPFESVYDFVTWFEATCKTVVKESLGISIERLGL